MARTKIILLENVAKLGPKYTIKSVASGFARNFLIARNKATLATDKALAQVEALKEKEGQAKVVKYDSFKKEIGKFDDLTVNLTAPANEEGHLYGAIHLEDIASALKDQHKLDIEPSWFTLKTPLKTTGEHLIEIIPDIKVGEKDEVTKAQLKV